MIINSHCRCKLFVLLLTYSFAFVKAEAIYTRVECYSYLTELVRSSNFPFLHIPSNNINLLIDSDNNEIIVAQLSYDKALLGISYETNQTGYSGWVKYIIKPQKLYNVSADIDPDTPILLNFDLNFARLFKSCLVSAEEGN